MSRSTSIRSNVRTFAGALAVAGLLAAVDIATKWFMENIVMNPPRRIPVLPFFDLVLVFNRGISFGLLGDLGAWGPSVLSGAAVGIVGMLVFWLWRTQRANEVVGITLVIGGALGNVLDRLEDEAVTDFFNLYAGSYHWPVFNIADTFITMGVMCLLVPNIGNRGGP